MSTIYTHSGEFHADEVMAIAILSIAYPFTGFKIVRTRDKYVLAEMNPNTDYMLDVGGEFNPLTHRFDHHQKGGVVINGRNYATAGLMWREHGDLCVQNWVKKNLVKLKPGKFTGGFYQEIADEIDRRIIMDLDALDTGDRLPKKGEYSFSQYISSFNPPIAPEGFYQTTTDICFYRALAIATDLISQEINHAVFNAMNKEAILSKVKDGHPVVVLDRTLPWDSVINEMDTPFVQRVVYPSTLGEWMVQKTPWSDDLPESWAGLRDEAFQEASGFEDGIFCHNARFIAGFKSMESANVAAYLSLDFEHQQTININRDFSQ